MSDRPHLTTAPLVNRHTLHSMFCGGSTLSHVSTMKITRSMKCNMTQGMYAFSYSQLGERDKNNGKVICR